MNNIIQVEKFCEDRNLQFTKIRKDVYELIFKSSIPLKAYDLLETLKNTHRSAKPITIYRALDFLLENKLIHKLPSQSTYFRCDHPADNHDCYFIICNQCHEIEEGCKDDLLKSIFTSLGSKISSVSNISLEIYGTCRKCHC